MAASWVPSTTEGSVLVDPLSNKLPHTEQLLSDNWIINAPQSEEGCLAKYGDSDPGSGCGYFWDSFFCWPPGDPETTIYVSCRAVLETMGVPVVNGSMAAGMDGLRAFRTCNASGHWSLGNWTNYTLCLDMLSDEAHDTLDHEPVPMAVIVGFVLFTVSIVSLIFMGVSLFIFYYFKSLECPRLRVHKNLVISLVLHTVSLLAISVPIVVRGGLIIDMASISWLCKFVLCLKMYSAMASINWMFIEGLMLHSRVTTNIFDRKFPFHMYYALGWGVPLISIVTWVILMTNELSSKCFEGYAESHFVWLITGPMLLLLLINCAFLINIIRILVTKVRQSSSLEATKVKAIKATLLLFPLLGTTHLLFCFNPKDNQLEGYYMVTNAVLQSSQGIFVTVLYCFLNSDVRRVVRNCYLRTEARRSVRRPVRTKSSSSSLLAKQMTIRQQKKNGVHTLVLFNDGAKKGRSDNEPSFLHELSVQPPPSAIFSDTNLASTCSSSV